jgi:hypothetical protein
MYIHKSIEEKELEDRLNALNLSDDDYRNLFWQLWGAFSVSNRRPWDVFSDIVTVYLDNKKEDK